MVQLCNNYERKNLFNNIEKRSNEILMRVSGDLMWLSFAVILSAINSQQLKLVTFLEANVICAARNRNKQVVAKWKITIAEKIACA